MGREREGVRGRERERETKRGTFSCVWRIRERGEHFKRFEGKQKWKKGRMTEATTKGRAKEGNNVKLDFFFMKTSQGARRSDWHIFNVHKVAAYYALSYCFFLRLSPSFLSFTPIFTSDSDVLRSMACRFSPPLRALATQFQSPSTEFLATRSIRMPKFSYESAFSP